MKKLAIFVEGQTEQIFFERLLNEYIAKPQSIQCTNSAGYLPGYGHLVTWETKSKASGSEYSFLLFNCEGDGKVVSAVKDRCNDLAAAGYKEIIAIRDLHPLSLSKASRLRKGIRSALRTISLPIHIVLAIMEIEAWFLAEHTHFEKIHRRLTMERIKSKVGFDPSADDMRIRRRPSKDLDEIYSIVSKKYDKEKKCVQRTVYALDLVNVHNELPQKFDDLNVFFNKLDEFYDS